MFPSAFCLLGFESGGVFQAEAEDGGSDSGECADQEGDAPRPCDHPVLGGETRDEGYNPCGQYETTCRGHLIEAAVEPASILRGILDEKRGGAGPFACNCDALAHAHEDQEDRSCCPD